jgi:NDP-sugar pyrophosphorylase family protein
MITKDNSYYKVLIPSAGLGSRLGEISKNLNKALVSIDNKPAISHVIEKFPEHIEIVIALGHKGDLVRQFLTMAYDNRKFTFVDVENFEGIGSGLGHSILCCEPELQCPFIFCPNDTIVLEKIPKPDSNWMGYTEVSDNIYRNLTFENNKVNYIYEKNTMNDGFVYIGVSGIYDYEKFWEYMKEGVNYGSINIGESYGLSRLIQNENNVSPVKFTWFDTGSKQNLLQTKKYFFNAESPQILEKSNESIWFVNKKVIKYFKNQNIVDKRIQRAKELHQYTPEIIDYSNNMYCYKMIKGKTLSSEINHNLFVNFINFSKTFWEERKLDEKDKLLFSEKCKEFYYTKTLNRIEMFFNRFNINDEEEIINGVQIPKISDLIEKVNWESMYAGTPVRYHGDFHFENILISENGEFVMLDWRQDFGGIIEYGDIYYDLAKLMHGLIVSHDLVSKNCFDFFREGGIIRFDILRKNKLVECENKLIKEIDKMGLDSKKVKILTAMIFLNIAALHHEPYGEFLFYLGKYMLNGEINE